MPDGLLVLAAICGLLCVAGGLLLVAAFAVARATGRTLLETFGGIGGVFAILGGGQEDELDLPARREVRQRRDLRAKAQQLDFDAAIAQQRDPSAQAAPTPSQPRPARPARHAPSEGQPLRRRRDDDDEGGLLDIFNDEV